MAGYGDDNGFTTWASDNGLTVPSGTVAAARNRGSAFVDGYEARFTGKRTGGYAQERAWPRTGATTYYGDAIPTSEVPNPIILASYAAAFQELTSPDSLSPVIVGSSMIKREKIGPMETEYVTGTTSADIIALTRPVVTAIDALLWPFLTQSVPAIMVV